MATDQREIAVIFDFDGTLAEDSTAAFARWMGVTDPQRDIYDKATELVSNGWDPPLAYLTLLCERVRKIQKTPIEKRDFVQFAKKFKPYTGVEIFLKGLRKGFESHPRIKEAGLLLNYYIISGGIADIIRNVRIAPLFKEIWACEFDYDKSGSALKPKAIVSFTEKTKYLFYINKGISGAQSRITPYAVNVELSAQDRPVPLGHMVYVGDGASDVPCMSIVNNAQPPGKTILVVGSKDVHKSWELLRRGRPVPPQYGKRGHAREVIEDAVLTVAAGVAEQKLDERKKQLTKKVGY